MGIVRIASSLCVACLLLLVSSAPPVCAQTVSVSVHPEHTSVPREGDAVVLRCEALGFQASNQFLSWVVVFPNLAKILTWEGELDSRVDDPSFSVINNATTGDPATVPEVQSLSIRPANRSHGGVYTCRVLERRSINTYADVANAQLTLTVYPVEVFPVCSPSGPADVSGGDTLSCTVRASTLSLVVSGQSDRPEWTVGVPPSGPGSRLTSPASSLDDGVLFNCSSVAADYPGVTLTCPIGPLSVSTPTTVKALEPDAATKSTTNSTQTSASSAGVVAGVLVVILLIILLVLAAVLYRKKIRPCHRIHIPTPSPSKKSSGNSVQNGTSEPPPKPVPYAQSRRHPSTEHPPAYAAVHRESDPAASQPEPGMYAAVHKPKKTLKPRSSEPAVSYRKSSDRESNEPVQYAVVSKPKKAPAGAGSEEQAGSDPAGSAHGPRPAVNGDGLVYAELDLLRPQTDEDKAKPVPMEEPTVYAVVKEM